MKSNNRQTYCSIIGILFILFMVSSAFAQQPDSALTQSQFMQIIDKIDKSEDNMRKHVNEKFDKLDTIIDEKFGELDKRIDNLDTKFNELDKKVALVDLKANILIGVFIGVITLVVIPILIPVLKQVVLNRLNERKNSEVPLSPQVAAGKHLKHGKFLDQV